MDIIQWILMSWIIILSGFLVHVFSKLAEVQISTQSLHNRLNVLDGPSRKAYREKERKHPWYGYGVKSSEDLGHDGDYYTTECIMKDGRAIRLYTRYTHYINGEDRLSCETLQLRAYVTGKEGLPTPWTP